MFTKIVEEKVFFPDEKRHGIKMSDDCKDFLKKILNKDPTKRLGTKNGLDEILGHQWLKDIDPNKMMNKQIKPLYKPKISKDIFDTRFFDGEFTD